MQFTSQLAEWRPPDIINEIGAAEGADFLIELIYAFQGDTANRVRELRQAITGCDLQRVRMESHTIKGSASQMGAKGMALVCQEIELAAGAGARDGLEDLAIKLEQSFADVCRAMAKYSRS